MQESETIARNQCETQAAAIEKMLNDTNELRQTHLEEKRQLLLKESEERSNILKVRTLFFTLFQLCFF